MADDRGQLHLGQTAEAVVVRHGAKKLTLHWNKPLVNYLGETFDASAAMGIELTPDGVSVESQDRQPDPLPDRRSVLPADRRHSGHRDERRAVEGHRSSSRPTAAEAVSTARIFRVFTNMSWLGDQGPEQYYSYPKDMPAPWMEFFAPEVEPIGLYRHAAVGPRLEGAAAGVGAEQLGHGARGRQLAPPQRTAGAAGRSQRVLCRLCRRRRPTRPTKPRPC